MENKTKTTITGVNPKTQEIHHMEFEGDAVCAIIIDDKGDGIASQEVVCGTVNAERAIALVKSMTNACSNLLRELPPIISHMIMNELTHDLLKKMEDDEQEALKEYDARRAAENELA